MFEVAIKILIMLLASNAAPILVAWLFRSAGELPLDLGRRLADGRPLFGSSKTWRGLVASLVVACVLSAALGFDYHFGLVFGALVMTGDLFSSFVKRRRGLAPGDQSLGLDQLPESIAPTLYAVAVTGIQWWWAILLPLAFMLLELAVSRPLYWLKIRKRPY
jgi:CDP-2,3-bis-(O-geranylgeranyl)-sn-glycerol synthase